MQVTQELRTWRQRYKQLTKEEITDFIQQGYVLVREAFEREFAERVIPVVWEELGIDPDDSSAWTDPLVTLRKVFEREPFPQILTPRYLGAVDDLCGPGRWCAVRGVGYWPILFPGFKAPPWLPPEDGWHLDFNFDGVLIDSAELGLVSIEIFSDIEPGGGGTAVRVGSHRFMARVFAEAEPGGLTLREIDLSIKAATGHLPVVEATGRAGDIILMHPLTVHATSSNTSDRARIAAVKLVRLYEKMDLNRRDTADYSPVELAIVNALGESGKL
jgi:hypothetical protein